MIVNIVENLMWITFSIVFFFYLTYFLVLLSYNKNSYIETEKDTNFYPSVSMIVPVYNEQSIIAKKLTNIKEMKYPNDKLEVIFVDGNSTDNTKKIIIEKIKDSNKNIKLIEQKKRKGYTQAVIQGILTSKGEIIFATDAASYHYPDTINQLVKHFTDPKIGAVTGKEIVLGQEKKIGPKLEKSYRLFYDFMRKAETKIDSTPDSKGEILAVRKKICINLIDKLELSPNASFDSCVPYQAKMMGLRTVYEDKARYYEYAPSSFLDRMKEKSRRATLLIGALLLFKEMILNRKYGKFGVVVLPVHFIINCILPMIFVVGVFSLVLLSFLNPIASIIPWVLAAGLLIATNNSRSLLISFIQSQIALIMGLFKLIRREKTLFIESIPSTRSLPNEQ